MANDVAVTASVHLTTSVQAGQDPACPSFGPFPFNFSEVGVREPLVSGMEVLPSDTFGGAEKVFDIPAHLRGPAGAAVQVFLLVRTDLPVKVRVRDVAASPVTFEKQLGVGGSVMIAGGDPDVDQLAFEGVPSSTPRAQVSIWLVSR